MAATNNPDFIKACDDYVARVRLYGEARAEQDKALLGWTLDPDRDYRDKAGVWREGYRAAAKRLGTGAAPRAASISVKS
ncbi:MAG: hypothetical protein AB1942_13020 [Pseudomonadota bacterium]